MYLQPAYEIDVLIFQSRDGVRAGVAGRAAIRVNAGLRVSIK